MKYIRQLAFYIFIFIGVSLYSQSITLYNNSTEIESFPLNRIQSISFENRNLNLNLLNQVIYSLSLNEVNKITFNSYSLGDVVEVPKNSKEKLKLYPNPVINLLNVKLPVSFQTEKIYIYAYNIDGRKIYDKQISFYGDLIRINTSNWESGIYLIEVHDGNEFLKNKIIKK